MEYMLFIATDPERGIKRDEPDIDEWVAEGERRGIRIAAMLCGPRGRDHRAGPRRAGAGVGRPVHRGEGVDRGLRPRGVRGLDQAIDYVTRHPMAHHGRIEIRPVQKFDE